MATVTQTTEIQNFIDGERRPAADGSSEPILNPATGEQIATAPLSGEDDVDAAVQAAKRAFPDWSETPPGERALALLRIADALEENGDELSQLESLNVGKPVESMKARRDAGPGRQPALLRRRGALPRRPRRRRVHEGLHVDDPPRAGRRRRSDRAVELPADDGDLEDRAGARRREHGGAEAVRADAADRGAPRRDRCRAPSEGRAERDLRPRGAGRRGPRPPPRRGDGLADRRRRDRQGGRAGRGRHAEAGAPRAGRQGARDRVRRRRPRGRGRGRQGRRLLQRRPGLHGRHARAGGAEAARRLRVRARQGRRLAEDGRPGR